jgi:Tfp pilus assembly protein PilF
MLAFNADSLNCELSMHHKTIHTRQSKTTQRNWFAVGLLCLSSPLVTVGCTTTSGARPSIWPTKTLNENAAAPASAGMTGTIASTTKAVKGQFASVGTAVSSAYGKAKTAITSPFGATDVAASDPATSATPGTKSTISPELYVMNGQLNESQGNYTKAIDAYSKALEIEPKNPSALLSTARLYERQNEKEKAVEFYKKASAVAPNNAAIYADLGNLQARSGNLADAKEQLQKAINLDPKSATYRSAMAGVLLDSGNADSAMSELMQVHNPAMANYQLAYLHFSRKNVPATQQYLATALQIDPNLKPARDLMASMGATQNISQIAQQGQNKLQQAQGIYQQASAIGGNVQGLFSAPAQPALPPPSLPLGAQPASSTGISASGFGVQPASAPSYESAAYGQPVRR